MHHMIYHSTKFDVDFKNAYILKTFFFDFNIVVDFRGVWWGSNHLQMAWNFFPGVFRTFLHKIKNGAENLEKMVFLVHPTMVFINKQGVRDFDYEWVSIR